MADWDGFRAELEGARTSQPPFEALRERRRRRQQRKAVAGTFAVVLMASATGLAVVNRPDGRGPGVVALPSATATPKPEDRFVNGADVPVPPDHPDYIVTDVDFVSPTLGWAIGLKCVKDRCGIASWRTTDGGATWDAPRTIATAVPRSSYHEQDPAGGAVRSIRMVNDREGFAFNPDLYVTHDGAATWTRVRQPSKVAYVQVQGDSAWLFERGCARDVDCDVVVRAGTVGPGFAPRDVAAPGTNGATASLRRESPERAFLLTWQPASGEPALHATTDGGATWQPRTHPCPDADSAALSAGLGRPLWVACSVGDSRTAYLSDDDGRTWRRSGNLPDKAELTDLIAVNATTAFATTQQPARLLRTDDAGATWQPVRGAALTGYGYGNLDVADLEHVWAMGDAGLLWRTTDGVAWERLALPPRGVRPPPPPLPPGPGVGTRSLSFTDTSHGWALGASCDQKVCRPVLHRTTDGGTTWTRANAPAEQYAADAVRGAPYRVTFADDKNGWLTGGDQFATHDGGRTWRRIPGGPLEDLTVRGGTVWALEQTAACSGTPCKPRPVRWAVADDRRTPVADLGTPVSDGALTAADADHAYVLVLGDEGDPVLAETADGGKTWRRHAVPCREPFGPDVSAFAPGRLWMHCGGEPATAQQPQRMLRTDDGGATWRTSPETYLTPLVSLTAFSPDVAWRVDASAGANVAGTRDGGLTWGARLEEGREAEFVDGTHGWALAGEYVYRTTDGRTWVRLG